MENEKTVSRRYLSRWLLAAAVLAAVLLLLCGEAPFPKKPASSRKVSKHLIVPAAPAPKR